MHKAKQGGYSGSVWGRESLGGRPRAWSTWKTEGQIVKSGEAGSDHAQKHGFYPKHKVHFKQGWDVIRWGLLKVPFGSCGSQVARTPRGYTSVCGKQIAHRTVAWNPVLAMQVEKTRQMFYS